MSLSKATFNFFKPRTIVLALVIAGSLWILLSPLKLTYDSHDYLKASESLDVYFFEKNTDGFTLFYRQPALPLYLYFFTDKILAAKWLNVFCFVTSLFLCYHIAQASGFESKFKYLYVALMACSYPWLQNHFFLWTEALFSVFLLLITFLIAAKKKIMWVAVTCLLLYFTRKAGVFLIVGVVLIYLTNRQFIKAIILIAIAGVVIIFWESFSIVLSNKTLYQSFFSDIEDLDHWLTADALSSWLLPHSLNLSIRLAILGGLAITLFIFFRRLIMGLTKDSTFKSVLILFLTYNFFIFLIGASEYNEAERFVSVVLPLAMILIIFIVRSIFIQNQQLRNLIWAAFILWTLYPIGRTMYHLYLQLQ